MWQKISSGWGVMVMVGVGVLGWGGLKGLYIFELVSESFYVDKLKLPQLFAAKTVSSLLAEVKRLTMDQNGKSFIIFNPF